MTCIKNWPYIIIVHQPIIILITPYHPYPMNNIIHIYTNGNIKIQSNPTDPNHHQPNIWQCLLFFSIPQKTVLRYPPPSPTHNKTKILQTYSAIFVHPTWWLINQYYCFLKHKELSCEDGSCVVVSWGVFCYHCCVVTVPVIWYLSGTNNHFETW